MTEKGSTVTVIYATLYQKVFNIYQGGRNDKRIHTSIYQGSKVSD